MYKLFILSGASGAGKTTLLDRIVNVGICKAAIKYSERKKFNTTDDITPVDDIDFKQLQCDIVYTMYGNKYGFSSKKIAEQLKQGNVILITNDISTIEKFNVLFPHQIVAVYIVSDINHRLLREIYMKRHEFPSIKHIEDMLVEHLKKAEEQVLLDDVKQFMQSIENINCLVDQLILEDKEYKLRLDSVTHQEKIYSISMFTYNYVVLNLYSNSKSTIHATKSAYEQLMKIIIKETGDTKCAI